LIATGRVTRPGLFAYIPVGLTRSADALAAKNAIFYGQVADFLRKIDRIIQKMPKK
jgi:hypothetical protein